MHVGVVNNVGRVIYSYTHNNTRHKVVIKHIIDIGIQINIIGYTRKEHKVNEIIMFIHCFCMVICTNTQLLIA